MEAAKVGCQGPPRSGDSLSDFGFSIAYPFTLRAAVQLNVPQILGAAGPGAELSAAEICQRFEDPARASPRRLEQILDVLACHGMLSVGAAAGPAKKYALTARSRELADPAAADYLRLMTAPEMLLMWPDIHRLVLEPEGPAPLEAAYGKGYYRHLKEDAPELAELYVGLLAKLAAVQLDCVLDCFDEELRAVTGTVVDVGGSHGSLAAALASKYPNIRHVVNYDLPDVVAQAPAVDRVAHVGGDFFEFVPHGDLMILKFVLLNGKEEQGVRLLRNCHEALPAKGKAIIVERVIMADPAALGPAERLRMAVQELMAGVMGGQLRSAQDIRRIAEAAGFAKFRVAKTVDTLAFVEVEKA